MNVNFKHKSGRVQAMTRNYAEILRRLGRGTYLTRDMQAVTPPKQSAVDELDGMNPEELHKLAKERGVEVHHRAGAEKVKEALRKAQSGE